MVSKNLTKEELAERLHVPLATLSRWRWMGTGPIFMQFGKHVSYKLKDVESFEEEKRRRDTTCSNFKDTIEEKDRGETK
jgi:predicted site-specific integrase-resolvase